MLSSESPLIALKMRRRQRARARWETVLKYAADVKPEIYTLVELVSLQVASMPCAGWQRREGRQAVGSKTSRASH